MELRLTPETVRETANPDNTSLKDEYLATAIAEVGSTARFTKSLDCLYTAFDSLCADVYNYAQELAEK